MAPGGLFVVTIRPIEFWEHVDSTRASNIAPKMVEIHQREGVAFLPSPKSADATYGDASYEPGFFHGNGWKLLGYEAGTTDIYQVALVLQAN